MSGNKLLRIAGPDATNGDGFHGMIGVSVEMCRVFERIERLAASRIPLLVCGETGTGKEMVARAIARESALYPLVALNCAEISPTLAESELFGHERGAFTGASRSREGIIARADGGTLFLDEVGELSAPLQVKLLRVLESGEYRPVGSDRVRRSRFRLITATNRDLDQLVERRRFRRDLLHRLGAVRIEVPPLRHRRVDVAGLVARFLRDFREEHRSPFPESVAPDALQLLTVQPWPGNVRELRHVVEAAAALTRGALVQQDDVLQFLPTCCRPPDPAPRPLRLDERVRQMERAAIVEALEMAAGDREQAAALLGVSVATLYRKMGGARS
jgi:two-component system, NtrC family, response regulator HydG